MRTILCYGDSNTWGYDAKTKGRFPFDSRWPGVLQKELGIEFLVIEEGLGGRTTVWDDPIEGYKNGKKYLLPCLVSHSPLDLVILMLGTNDLKKRFSLSAFDVAAGVEELVKITLNYPSLVQAKPPKIILISPIHIGETIVDSEFNEMFGYEESIKTCKKLAFYYKQVAEKYNCEFIDAAQIVTAMPLDAIHIDEKGHFKLGSFIADCIKKIYS